MRRAAAAATLVLTGFFAIPVAFAPGDLPPTPAPADTGIPPAALAAYQQWGQHCPGLDWALLAAIGQVESGHGTSGGASIDPDGTVTPPIHGPSLDGSGRGGNTTPIPAGQWSGRWGITGPWLQAVGPMQFLPGTFAAWAIDGNADGITDPHNIFDAVASAANYLCGPTDRIGDEAAALRRYNNSGVYIQQVQAVAASYRAYGAPLGLLGVGTESVAEVLANPRITIYAGGRADLDAGRVDGRVVDLLATLGRNHTLTVTSLVTGHPRCAVNGQPHGPGCVESNHYHGRAVDIAVLDGQPVSAAHAVATQLMTHLAALPEGPRPDEIGGPVNVGGPGVFSNRFHTNHLHIGWRD